MGEIKKDQDWKEKVAEEWNANGDDKAEEVEKAHSVFSYSKCFILSQLTISK